MSKLNIMKLLNHFKFKAMLLVKFLLTLFFVTLISCSPNSNSGSSGNLTSLAGCEYLYEEAFISTFHSFVRSAPRTCTNCHDDPATSHQFGLADGNVSFDNFLLMSNAVAGAGRATDAKNKLRAAALDPGHFSSGDPAYLTTLDSYETSWSAVDSAYSDCVSGN